MLTATALLCQPDQFVLSWQTSTFASGRLSRCINPSPFKGGCTHKGLTQPLLTQVSQARLGKSADARDESVVNFTMFHASGVPVRHHCLISTMSWNVMIHMISNLYMACMVAYFQAQVPQMYPAAQELCTEAASRCADMCHACVNMRHIPRHIR